MAEATTYISENTPVSSPEKQQGVSEKMTDDEKKTIKMCMCLFEKAKEERSDVDKDWQMYLDFYNGKQWPKKRSSYKASPNMNVIRSAVQTILPIMTDKSPAFDVMPKVPDDFEFSEVIAKVIDSWWSNRSMDLTMVEGIMDSLLLSAGVLKVIWNEDLEEGLGDIDVHAVDPMDIFVPKNAVDFTKKCSYVVHRMRKTVGELRRLYPEKAHLIKSGGNMEKDEQMKAKALTGDPVLTSPITRKSSIDNMTDVQGGSYSDNDEVEVLEFWLDDYSIVEYKLATEDPEKKEKVEQRYKYPKGRLVTIIPSLRVLLQDTENPYSDGRKPFVRIVDTILPRQFWGEGEVQPLIETQKLVNKTAATIVDYMNRMTNPVWIVDNQSGVEPEMLTNQIGLIISKNQGTEVRREEAPNIPAKVFEWYGTMMQLLDQQSGIHDQTRGRKPTGITAAEAIQTMQEAAQTRIRLKERNLESSLEQLGFLVVSRIMQYYREPRIVRMTGNKNLGWPEFFEFFIEPVPGQNETTMYSYNQQSYVFDEIRKRFQPLGWSTSKPSRGLFDINVSAGTSLPWMKSQRGQLAIRLHDSQLIDQESVLETLDWPKKDEIMKRMKEDQKQQALGQPQGPGASQLAGLAG